MIKYDKQCLTLLITINKYYVTSFRQLDDLIYFSLLV